MTDVSLIIPTFKRPGPLAEALASVFAQEGLGQITVELIVVDNDPACSARPVVEALTPRSPFPVRYVSCPEPGVANARNAAAAAARGPMIAFLDDDQEAAAFWLMRLLRAQATTGADVVFGPVIARLPGAPRAVDPYLRTFFSRLGPQGDQVIEEPFGCGNCLLVRATTLIGPTPFDVRTNESGGEDDQLFRAVRARGGVFGWAGAASVVEVVPEARASLRYTIRRAFGHGQGASLDFVEGGALDPMRLGLCMLKGVFQAVGMATVALFLAAPAPAKAAWALDRAARGLGKVFWGRRFQIKFYGAASTIAQAPAAAAPTRASAAAA
jgi:succinoglycan biosynthesis protein ExoM